MSDSVSPFPRPVPVREDCWSHDASKTLIEAWGGRFVELNRGNLRQKDWQQVADVVNARHGHSKTTYRTDVQCKNRIDTIKKKYKVEKARVSASGGMVGSSWPFFDRLDELIGSNLKKPVTGGAVVSISVSESMLSRSPPMALPMPHLYRTSAAPLATAVLSKKRASPAADDSYFRRNYSAVAAAAAAAASNSTEEEDDDENEDGRAGDEVEVDAEAEAEEEEEEDEEMVNGFRRREGSEDGIMKLATAIRKFGDVYAKVEALKLDQMVEMEKQRIQFTKDLEVQRMQMYVNMQLQLKKIKIAKANLSNGQSN